MSSRTDTIFAVSSGAVKSGIAVVRVSGSEARFVTETIATPLPLPRRASLRDLKARDAAVIDQALVLWFPAPHSFTGEDCVEFHVHGSAVILRRLLATLSSFKNLRLAEPGEFSKRAFLNGQIDLTQAEGLVDLIDAETDAQHAAAVRALKGETGQFYHTLRHDLLHGLAYLEATLDFSDEGDVEDHLETTALVTFNGVIERISQTLAFMSRPERLRDGFQVALAGAPNAGKSTLFNAIAQRDVALVSPFAGTTRDVLSVALEMGGLPLTLFDLAGLRSTTDVVEKMGIDKAQQKAQLVDLVLWLTDGKTDIVPDASFSIVPDVIVFTKRDIADVSHSDLIDSVTKHFPTVPVIHVSAHTGEGLDILLDLLQERAALLFGTQEAPVILRERYRVALQQALTSLQQAVTPSSLLPELRAEHVRHALRSLGSVIGAVDVEDVLDVIFGSFCIGK